MKCWDIWPVSHHLPPLRILGHKRVKGMEYLVYPPLVQALMKLVPDIMVYDGGIMLCTWLDEEWAPIQAKVRELLTPAMLEFNGAISTSRRPYEIVLWCNHRHGDRIYNNETRNFNPAFVPRLCKLLLQCDKVQSINVFNSYTRGATGEARTRSRRMGIVVEHLATNDWDFGKLLPQLLSVLDDPWCQRWINPPVPGTCFAIGHSDEQWRSYR